MSTSFNPLPALRPGDTTLPSSTRRQLLFQSTPGFKAGRYCRVRRRLSRTILFQSTPGFKAGRYPRRSTERNWHKCFNPLPALRPGDTKLPSGWREGAVFQSTPGFKAGRYVLIASNCWKKYEFQSTPGFKAGRY